jgi:hypothetical protein
VRRRRRNARGDGRNPGYSVRIRGTAVENPGYIDGGETGYDEDMSAHRGKE